MTEWNIADGEGEAGELGVGEVEKEKGEVGERGETPTPTAAPEAEMDAVPTREPDA